MSSRVLHGVFLAVFAASGVAALVYQIVWQRLLTLFGGADLYAVTLIVMAFMAGLGVGSLAGGHLADRLSARSRLLAFAGAEAAIAAFAWLSTALLYDTLYLRLGERPLAPGLVTSLLFLVLLWPTFFMGLSLPLLARALTESVERAADRVGGLYAWNTLGAAVGAAASFALVRAWGFDGAVRFGAALNLACAAAVLAVVALRQRPSPGLATESKDLSGEKLAPGSEAPVPLAAWLVVYGLSGFVALSLEIVWFRILGWILRSTSVTFPTLLGLYLAGLGAGALFGRRLARGARRPGAVFFALQLAIPTWAVASLAAFVAALQLGVAPGLLVEHLQGENPLPLAASVRAAVRVVLRFGEVAPWTSDAAARLLLVHVCVPAAFVLVPTLLMGASFPFLQARVQTDLRGLGRRVGWLQAANIAGSTLGAGLTGVVLLGVLGTTGTLRLLSASAAVFLFLLMRSYRTPRATRWLVPAAAAALLAAAVPPGDALWSRTVGSEPTRIRLAEDGSGVSVLKTLEPGRRQTHHLLAGGLHQSDLPFGGYHAVLGALPTLVHPGPRRVAIIGLGTGNTAYAAGGRHETERVLVLEIVGSQVPLLLAHVRATQEPGLLALLADGRFDVRVADGRTHLMRTTERYDVIEADALRPVSAYAGNLFSREYFDLVRRRLAPGGVGVSWSPTPRVRDTFLSVFPHAIEIGDMLLGSDAPVAFEAAAVRARMRDPALLAHFGKAGVDVVALIEAEIVKPVRVYGPEAPRRTDGDLNTDLFPRDEYLASERFWPSFARGSGPE
jgi:predicted membrane-bound spermidine synthase